MLVGEREDFDRRAIGRLAKRFRLGWLSGHGVGGQREGEDEGVGFHGGRGWFDLTDNRGQQNGEQSNDARGGR